jgi:hypothetical protein
MLAGASRGFAAGRAALAVRKRTAAREEGCQDGRWQQGQHQYERIVVSSEGATAREIRIYGRGDRLILEGWQVADDSGQTAWISDAGAIAVFGQPLSPGETTDAGPLWFFDNFSEVKEMGSCSPPFMADVAKALGERYEPA